MSNKQVFYKQCKLVRDKQHQTAWIPEEFAVDGKFIKLKQDDDTWEDGWQVVSAGDVRLEGSALNERSQDYKKTRQASDI